MTTFGITRYKRINIKTGAAETIEFSKYDGERFDTLYRNGFDTETALLIVNRWNYISALQPGTVDYLYYLPTVEGAA